MIVSGIPDNRLLVKVGDEGIKLHATVTSGFNVFGDDIPLGDVAIRAASTNPDVVSISNDSLHKLTYHKPGEAKIVLYDKESGLYGICQIKVLPADLNIENPVFPKTVAGGSFGMVLKADGTVWTQ